MLARPHPALLYHGSGALTSLYLWNCAARAWAPSSGSAGAAVTGDCVGGVLGFGVGGVLLFGGPSADDGRDDC